MVSGKEIKSDKSKTIFRKFKESYSEKLKGLSEYPSMESMFEMDRLIRSLISESKLTKKDLSDDIKLEEIYLTQGFDLPNKDVYKYASAALLSEALSNSKQLYYKEGIDIDIKNLLSDKYLFKIIPESLNARTHTKLNELINTEIPLIRAGEQMLQGIETKIMETNIYFDRFTSRGHETLKLKEFLEKQAESIASYAKFGQEISRILRKGTEKIKAASLEAACSYFTDTDNFIKTINSAREYPAYSALYNAHAQLVGTSAKGNLWWMIGNHTGEEISALMELSKDIESARQRISYAKYNPKVKDAFFSFGGYISQIPAIQELLQVVKENGEEVAIVNNILDADDGYNMHLIETGKGVIANLEEKIEGEGIPFEMAKIIGEYMDNVLSERTVPVPQKIKKKELYNHIRSKDEFYIDSVRILVERATGKTPRPLRYLFNETAEQIKSAPSISPIIYRTKTSKDGSIIRMQELWGRGDEAVAKSRTKELFSEDDIYIRTNQGAAHILNSSRTIGAINPKYTLIDVRDAFSRLGDDSTLNDLARLHVDAHEIVHSSQTGSRAMWRSMATSVAQNMISQALIALDDGRLDRINPYDDKLVNSRKRRLRDSLADITEWYTTPALATGDIGEKMRNEGGFEAIYEGINADYQKIVSGVDWEKHHEKTMESMMLKVIGQKLEKGDKEDVIKAFMNPNEDTMEPLMKDMIAEIISGGKKGDAKRKEIEKLNKERSGLVESGCYGLNNYWGKHTALEDSKTTRLVMEALGVLRKGSKKQLEEMYTRLQRHEEELTSIVEHMAESFSSVAMREYFQNFPDKNYSKEQLDKYYTRLDKSLNRRGILAMQYQESIAGGKTGKERDKILHSHGLTYTRQFNRIDEERIEDKLVKLGYDPVDPYEAYDDMDELKKRAEEAKIPLNRLYSPMNGSKAMIGLRYDTHLKEYETIIKHMGPHKAFEKLLTMESTQDVIDLAASYKSQESAKERA